MRKERPARSQHLEQAYRKLDCHDQLSAVLVGRDCSLLGAHAVDVGDPMSWR